MISTTGLGTFRSASTASNSARCAWGSASPTKGTDTPASRGNVVTIGSLVTLRRSRPRRAEPCVQDRKVDTGTSMCRAASVTEYSGTVNRSSATDTGTEPILAAVPTIAGHDTRCAPRHIVARAVRC
jgi:hypothetical protein